MLYKKKASARFVLSIVFVILFFVSGSSAERINKFDLQEPLDDFIKLLIKRRSVRSFSNAPLTTQQLSYLLYAADARTPNGNRTAPSARAVYPIDIYVFVRNVTGLEKGIYYYNPRYHYLQTIKKGDFSAQLSAACRNQTSISQAAAVLSMFYVISRMKPRFGEQGVHYAALEAGHISQNFLLAAAKLNLGAVPVGGFENEKVLKILEFSPQKKVTLYLNPVGNIR